MQSTLKQWAERWQIPRAAMADLVATLAPVPPGRGAAGSEASVLQQVRLRTTEQGARLWRNNNGACVDSEGRHLRYGLANDSRQLNAVLKSSDLIGITPRVIGAADVGRVVGIFTAYECKAPAWHYTGTEREQAQLAFLALVEGLGGIGKFINSAEQVGTIREYGSGGIRHEQHKY